MNRRNVDFGRTPQNEEFKQAQTQDVQGLRPQKVPGVEREASDHITALRYVSREMPAVSSWQSLPHTAHSPHKSNVVLCPSNHSALLGSEPVPGEKRTRPLPPLQVCERMRRGVARRLRDNRRVGLHHPRSDPSLPLQRVPQIPLKTIRGPAPEPLNVV